MTKRPALGTRVRMGKKVGTVIETPAIKLSLGLASAEKYKDYLERRATVKWDDGSSSTEKFGNLSPLLTSV